MLQKKKGLHGVTLPPSEKVVKSRTSMCVSILILSINQACNQILQQIWQVKQT